MPNLKFNFPKRLKIGISVALLIISALIFPGVWANKQDNEIKRNCQDRWDSNYADLSLASSYSKDSYFDAKFVSAAAGFVYEWIDGSGYCFQNNSDFGRLRAFWVVLQEYDRNLKAGISALRPELPYKADADGDGPVIPHCDFQILNLQDFSCRLNFNISINYFYGE